MSKSQTIFQVLDHYITPKLEKGRPKTIYVPCRIPIDLIEKMDELIKQGRHKDRSEIIRIALSVFITSNNEEGFRDKISAKQPEAKHTYCPLCTPYQLQGEEKYCEEHEKWIQPLKNERGSLFSYTGVTNEPKT